MTQPASSREGTTAPTDRIARSFEIEELARSLSCHAIVSDAVVRVARQDVGADAEQILAAFRPGTEQTLRGRVEPVAIWLH
jgi:hypothetical protein